MEMGRVWGDKGLEGERGREKWGFCVVCQEGWVRAERQNAEFGG